MKNNKASCSECKAMVRTSKLGKIKGKDGLYCYHCRRRARRKKYLKKIEKLKESEPEPVIIIKPVIQKETKQLIKQEDIKKENKVPRGINLSLHEKQFLFSKLVKHGMDRLEAKERINKICFYLTNLVNKLRKKNKSEVDINQKFKKEFEKLCRSLEV